MLRTKCILHPAEPEDGTRISVMGRHTLSDGKTKDARIVPGISYDEHMPELAPPLKLVGLWHRSIAGGAERRTLWRHTFEPEYKQHLYKEEVHKKVAALEANFCVPILSR